jgi:hypothetical protein
MKSKNQRAWHSACSGSGEVSTKDHQPGRSRCMRIRSAIVAGSAGLAGIALAVGAVCLLTQARWAAGPLAAADHGLRTLAQLDDLERAGGRVVTSTDRYHRSLDRADGAIAAAALATAERQLGDLTRSLDNAAADSLIDALRQLQSFLSGSEAAEAAFTAGSSLADSAAAACRGRLQAALAAQAQHQRVLNSRDGLDFRTRTTVSDRLFACAQAVHLLQDMEAARRGARHFPAAALFDEVRNVERRIRDLLEPWTAAGDLVATELSGVLAALDRYSIAIDRLEPAWRHHHELAAVGQAAGNALRLHTGRASRAGRDQAQACVAAAQASLLRGRRVAVAALVLAVGAAIWLVHWSDRTIGAPLASCRRELLAATDGLRSAASAILARERLLAEAVQTAHAAWTEAARHARRGQAAGKDRQTAAAVAAATADTVQAYAECGHWVRRAAAAAARAGKSIAPAGRLVQDLRAMSRQADLLRLNAEIAATKDEPDQAGIAVVAAATRELAGRLAAASDELDAAFAGAGRGVRDTDAACRRLTFWQSAADEQLASLPARADRLGTAFDRVRETTAALGALTRRQLATYRDLAAAALEQPIAAALQQAVARVAAGSERLATLTEMATAAELAAPPEATATATVTRAQPQDEPASPSSSSQRAYADASSAATAVKRALKAVT